MGKSKLEVTGKLMESECKAQCVRIECKRQRMTMTKLRGGTAELAIKVGRCMAWSEEKRKGVARNVEVVN